MLDESGLMAAGGELSLVQQANPGVLRFIVCGGAAEDRSILIERLLGEFPVRPKAPLAVSGWGEKYSGGLVYRCFATEQCRFMVLEMPSHVEEGHGIIAGALAADVAVVLVDASQGLVSQDRYQAFLANLLGGRHLLVLVHKMDLVNFSEAAYLRVVEDFRQFAARIGAGAASFIPLATLAGDNMAAPSAKMPWYCGDHLVGGLERLALEARSPENLPFRLQVQQVDSPDQLAQRFAGVVASGQIGAGDRIRVQPSGQEGRVARIVTAEGIDLPLTIAGQSVSMILEGAVELARGDLVSAAEVPAEVADQFEVSLIWLHEEPLLAGRSYLMKIGVTTVPASVTSIKYRINVDTQEHVAARKLGLGEIAECNLGLERPIAFDSFRANRAMGSFLLIDRQTDAQVGVGLINFALRRSHNIHLQPVDVNKRARSILKRQKSCVLWFTGLSGAGKSSIANLVEKKLHAQGCHTYLLDGDNVRHGLNKDLGFTDADRVENIRRVAEVSKLMVDAGLIVLTAFISPFRAERQMARSLLEEGEFLEVFVDAPLAVAEQRDVKGLYKKARRGELKNFTGIDSPYEQPEHPELRIDTSLVSLEAAADAVLALLRERGGILD